MTGPVNVKTIPTLNVKIGRSGKCENNSTLKKKFGQLHNQSDDQFGRPGQFFFVAFSGFGVSTFQKLKNLGKCHDLERKCKMLIQERTGEHFLGVLDVKKK